MWNRKAHYWMMSSALWSNDILSSLDIEYSICNCLCTMGKQQLAWGLFWDVFQTQILPSEVSNSLRDIYWGKREKKKKNSLSDHQGKCVFFCFVCPEKGMLTIWHYVYGLSAKLNWFPRAKDKYRYEVWHSILGMRVLGQRISHSILFPETKSRK